MIEIQHSRRLLDLRTTGAQSNASGASPPFTHTRPERARPITRSDVSFRSFDVSSGSNSSATAWATEG
jgi:hypothetical protein